MSRYLLLLLIIPLLSVAQSDSITISATVFDNYTGRPLAGVSIINPRTGFTISSGARGNFFLQALRSDNFFLFYPAYRTGKFSVADSVAKDNYTLVLGMEPLSTGLGQAVIIKAPKTLEQIEEDRRKLGTTPKELDRPIIEPFSSPISALYELLSNRAREREKLKKQMIEDDRRKIFRELLDYYNENKLIDLPEENYEEFMSYCDLPLDFLKYSSDYEITKTVIDAYKRYGRNSGLIK